MSNCRIGKIKLKAGGVIHRLPAAERDEAQKKIVSGAAKIAEFYEPGEMHGYVVIGWAEDGTYAIGYRIEPESFVGATMLPSYIADALRRELINNREWED